MRPLTFNGAANEFNGICAVAVRLRGRIARRRSCDALWALPARLLDFSGLGVEFGGHQAQPFGARQVEAASRDAEAVFGLATQELRGQHDGFVQVSFLGLRWIRVSAYGAKCGGPGCWFRCLERASGIIQKFVKAFIEWEKSHTSGMLDIGVGDGEFIEQIMNISRIAMGPATPQPTLNHLRQTLAEIDPSHAPRLAGEERLVGHQPPRSTPPLAAGLPAGRCTNLLPLRPCISAPPAALPSRWLSRASGAPPRGALDRHRLRGRRGRRTLRSRPRPVGLDFGAPSGAARAQARRCALGDGGGAALPRARLRHRRNDRRRRGGRSHRDAPAGARRARRRERAQLRLRPADPPQDHAMPSAAATRWEIAGA